MWPRWSPLLVRKNRQNKKRPAGWIPTRRWQSMRQTKACKPLTLARARRPRGVLAVSAQAVPDGRSVDVAEQPLPRSVVLASRSPLVTCEGHGVGPRTVIQLDGRSREPMINLCYRPAKTNRTFRRTRPRPLDVVVQVEGLLENHAASTSGVADRTGGEPTDSVPSAGASEVTESASTTQAITRVSEPTAAPRQPAAIVIRRTDTSPPRR